MLSTLEPESAYTAFNLIILNLTFDPYKAGLLCIQLINAVYTVLAQLTTKDGANPIVFSFYRDLGATPILFAAAWWGGASSIPGLKAPLVSKARPN